MRRNVWGTALLVLALAVTGCGSNDHGDTSSSSGAAGGEGVIGPGAAPASPAARPGAVRADLRLAREVVRTGSMTVRVDDLDKAVRATNAVADTYGGYVQHTETGVNVPSVLTLRVPPARFAAATDAVARLGTVTERRFAAEDVTEDVADVEGRLAAARASVARLRSLIARARSVSEIASIEGQLNTREAELESLESRRRALAGSTSLATLTVTLLPPPGPPRPIAKPKVGGFVGGLRAGLTALATLFNVLLVAAGVLLPFAIAAFVVAAPWVAWTRRKRGRYSTADG